MTRPKKEPDDCKGYRLTIRMTKADYGGLAYHADRHGTSVANYARLLLTQSSIPTRTVPGADRLSPVLHGELKRIGNNLNQLTHAANAGLTPRSLSLIRTLDGIITLLTEDETTAPRIRAARTARTIANDTPPSQKGIELQRGVRLYSARPGQEFDA